VTDLVTRFAPSPTGYLHLGHAASAWHVWTLATRIGAQVLLRIEDIDTTRCRPHFTEAILEDLAWLGFEWTEPVRRQSNHFPDYAATVSRLAEWGLAYRCFRTRAEVLEEQGDALAFTGWALPERVEQENLEKGTPFAWRLSLMAAQQTLGSVWNELSFKVVEAGQEVTRRARPDLCGDIVIARKDSLSAYHLAATHDDAVQGVTHVVRGRDLIDAPHIQTLLQALLGWSQPCYHHHDLVGDTAGQRLSKTRRSVPLRQLRQDGVDPSSLWDRLGLI
jgi:glutamyl-Q tRNA(Asp) synthetase